MRIEMQIDDSLKHRDELIKIMNAAADYLKSRDTDPDSEARAVWRLWAGPDGEARIGLGLQDQGYSRSQQFSPNQLVPTDIREHRLIEIWNDVLQQRTHRQVARVNELISQMED